VAQLDRDYWLRLTSEPATGQDIVFDPSPASALPVTNFFGSAADVSWNQPPVDQEEACYYNAASCPDCGGGMVRLGGCFTCPGCGYQSCGF
jgi:hypothetical protein